MCINAVVWKDPPRLACAPAHRFQLSRWTARSWAGRARRPAPWWPRVPRKCLSADPARIYRIRLIRARPPSPRTMPLSKTSLTPRPSRRSNAVESELIQYSVWTQLDVTPKAVASTRSGSRPPAVVARKRSDFGRTSQSPLPPQRGAIVPLVGAWRTSRPRCRRAHS